MGARRIAGITVEIGGDTTKLTAALKDVDKALSTTQSSLRDVNKLLKLDPGNTELLAQKHRLLGEAVAETKEKLAALKTAAEQANQALANGEMTQGQYDALQREIIETEQKLKDLEKQAENSNVALQKIGQFGDKLQAVGDKVSGVGENLTKSVTAPVVGLGTAAVATAANFESSMSQVQATMGITKDSMSMVNGESVNTMDTLSALAKQMGSETAFSASECAEALNYLALAGYDTQEMCDTLPTVLNLAAAGGIDLASASDMVTDAMSALGMGTDEATTMVDQMAKTSSTTNTSVAQLGDAILTIGATAKSVKGGTAELNAALGILANNGIKGAEGGTHLRNVILSLQNPTDKAAACMEQLGVDVYDSEGNMRSLNDVLGDLNTSMDGMTSAEKSNIIATIFNKTDLAAVNALLANTGESWDTLQQSITESGGAAQQMADTQLDNLQGQLTILKSALEGLAISLGEILLPIIKNVVSGIQGFVDWLNSLDGGQDRSHRAVHYLGGKPHRPGGRCHRCPHRHLRGPLEQLRGLPGILDQPLGKHQGRCHRCVGGTVLLLPGGLGGHRQPGPDHLGRYRRLLLRAVGGHLLHSPGGLECHRGVPLRPVDGHRQHRPSHLGRHHRVLLWPLGRHPLCGGNGLERHQRFLLRPVDRYRNYRPDHLEWYLYILLRAVGGHPIHRRGGLEWHQHLPIHNLDSHFHGSTDHLERHRHLPLRPLDIHLHHGPGRMERDS